MIDRQSNIPGRVKITWDDGTVQYGIMERADEPTAEGTPLNKNTLFNSKNEERFGVPIPSEAFSLLTNEPIVVVPLDGWSTVKDEEGYYTNQVAVENMKAEYSPIFSLVIEDAETAVDKEVAFSDLKRVTTYDNFVIFKATDIPSIDIKVKLKGV